MNDRMCEARDVPCPGCPYRRDVPSGVWAAEEYVKLVGYDGETSRQPQGVFLCHCGDREKVMCRGWLDVIDKDNSLALRLGVAFGDVTVDVYDLPTSGVPVFASGQEAHDHGVIDIESPGPDAMDMVEKLQGVKGVKFG